MTVEIRLPAQIDYQEYRYGRSRQAFRGPIPDLETEYIACIGGSETYGKFAPKCFPQFLSDSLSMTVANWGASGAGPSFFLKDPVLLEACSNARACVISVMGATNNSNRLYSVFQRRNERLRDASDLLKALYPDMPFDHYRFAVNMLLTLYRENPDNFKVVELELRQAWLGRMRELLNSIETRKILLWFADNSPDDPTRQHPPNLRTMLPTLVNRSMVEEIVPLADVYVEYVAPPQLAGKSGPQERIPGPMGEDAARRFPSQSMHQDVSVALHEAISGVLKMPFYRPTDDR